MPIQTRFMRFALPCPYIVSLEVTHDSDRTIRSFVIRIEAIPVFREAYDMDKASAEAALVQNVRQFRNGADQNRATAPRL